MKTSGIQASLRDTTTRRQGTHALSNASRLSRVCPDIRRVTTCTRRRPDWKEKAKADSPGAWFTREFSHTAFSGADLGDLGDSDPAQTLRHCNHVDMAARGQQWFYESTRKSTRRMESGA